METSTGIAPSGSSRTLKADPQYFGACINMALHNVYLINNHLAGKFGNGIVLANEADIGNYFLTTKVTDNPNHYYSYLVRLLPFVRIYNTALLPAAEKKAEHFRHESIDFEALAVVLKECFTQLRDFRNGYSHFYTKTNTRKLDVPVSLAELLRTLYQEAILYTKQRFSAVLADEDFNHLHKTILVGQDNIITQHGLTFFICLFLQREYAFLFLSKVKGFKNTQTKAFLATREVFCAFCLNLPAEKLISTDREQAMILDMLNYLNRCPDELFDCLSANDKVPFQPTLNTEKMSNVTSNSMSSETDYEDYDDYIKSITSRRRHGDRFPYFALRYLDEQPGFTPRFHLNLGKAILKSYPKMVLGKEVVRDVVSDIKTFGRLGDFFFDDATTEEEREEKAKNRLRLDADIRFTQYAPHYHIKSNKIALSTTGNATPNAQLSIHELPKLVLLELLCKGRAAALIGAFLTTHTTKLLNRTFIEDIKQQLGFEESLQRAFFNRKKVLNSFNYLKYAENIEVRKKHLDGVLAQYHLSSRQVPGRIVDYWLNIKLVKEETTIKNNLKEQKKECKDRLKQLQQNRGPRIGEMATWLAKDIVAMVIDEGVKQKITSFYYDKMQECLALFADRDKKSYFLGLCTEALNLFDTKVGHPFLEKIDFNTINRTTDLYRAYLNAKGAGTRPKKIHDKENGAFKEVEEEYNWMYNTFYEKQKNKKTGKWETLIRIPATGGPLPLSIKKMLKERSSFDAWLTNTGAGKEDAARPRAVDLPTNLFDAALTDLLKEKAGIDPADARRYNYSRLLELWLKDTQPFYNGKREYQLYKDAGGTPAVKVTFTPGSAQSYAAYFKEPMERYLQTETSRIKKQNKQAGKHIKAKPLPDPANVLNSFNRAITENEKLIRFSQTKDRVMCLILQELMQARTDMQVTFLLKDIYPGSERSPLNMPFTIRQRVPVNAKKAVREKIVTDANRKVKDYGALRKLLTDRRLPTLFGYFPEDEIPYTLLRMELEAYNNYKDALFDQVFALEKACIVKMTDEEIEKELIEKSKFNNIQHTPYLDWLEKNGFLNKNDKEVLLVVRNAFSHNEFPEKSKIIEHIPLHTAAPVAQQVIAHYTVIVDKTINLLA